MMKHVQYPSSLSLAQSPSRKLRLGIILMILGVGFAHAPQSLLGQENTPDPTKPSEMIADRMRTVSPANQATIQSLTLPTVPELQLKAIVMSDDSHGSAWIDHNGKTIRIKLDRERTKDLRSLAVPENQFVQKRGVKQDDEITKLTLDFSNMLQLGDRWLKVKAFNASMIVFEALPDGRLLIVR